MSPSGSNPFFVVGAQRSGTTMLRLMLNQHSHLCVPFESVFIPALYRRLHEFDNLRESALIEALLTAISDDPWVRKGGLIPDRSKVLSQQPKDYASLVDAIFTAYAQTQHKVRWGDKTPGYVIDIDVLCALFPDCRIIHLVRDGRDVVLSLAGLSWGSRDLFRNAADWRWKTLLGRKMGNMIGAHYLEVRYEDLVTHPSQTLERICDFLGENFEPGMLNYPLSAEQIMPRQSLRWHRSSVSAPDPSKAFHWRTRMPLSDQIVFEDVAGDALELFGYDRIRHKHTFGSRVRFARYALLGRP